MALTTTTTTSTVSSTSLSINTLDDLSTGRDVRQACRSNSFASKTSGLASKYIQANLIVLPSAYAIDFRLLCQRNPVPCPLLAESAAVGSFNELKSWLPGLSGQQIANDVDLRRDFPKYTVYHDGELVPSRSGCLSIDGGDTADHVAFLIGCSFSFENALTSAGLTPPHVEFGRNVPMYVTTHRLCPAGVFVGGTYVVSMRFYSEPDIETIRNVTRPYVATHGEPIDWGWGAINRLGIKDLERPEFGDAPVLPDGRLFTMNLLKQGMVDDVVPVYWGCGVTPQEAVRRAKLKGTVFGHLPGHMIVLDIKDSDICKG